jgi:hypothetical protein
VLGTCLEAGKWITNGPTEAPRRARRRLTQTRPATAGSSKRRLNSTDLVLPASNSTYKPLALEDRGAWSRGRGRTRRRSRVHGDLEGAPTLHARDSSSVEPNARAHGWQPSDERRRACPPENYYGLLDSPDGNAGRFIHADAARHRALGARYGKNVLASVGLSKKTSNTLGATLRMHGEYT